MNRSFLIVIVPAMAVALGYLLMFHWLVVIAAVILVQWRQRRKASRGSR